jgi:hypothetical protein
MKKSDTTLAVIFAPYGAAQTVYYYLSGAQAMISLVQNIPLQLILAVLVAIWFWRNQTVSGSHDVHGKGSDDLT